jgi:hypothetical protein
MAYYRPLQNQTTKKWFYCCTNDAGTFEEPCCAQLERCPTCRATIEMYHSVNAGKDCSTCDNKRLVPKVDACLGHDTAEEAIEHNRQYDLDKAVVAINNDEQHKCKICEAWT